MLAAEIVEPDTLIIADGQVSVSVRMPWYRALPLSSIADVKLDIDGVEVPTPSLRWTVNEQTYPIADLAEHWQDWWYVLDSAVISGPAPDLPETDTHQVHVTLALYIPYLPGAEGVVKIVEQDFKQMPVGVSA